MNGFSSIKFTIKSYHLWIIGVNDLWNVNNYNNTIAIVSGGKMKKTVTSGQHIYSGPFSGNFRSSRALPLITSWRVKSISWKRERETISSKHRHSSCFNWSSCTLFYQEFDEFCSLFCCLFCWISWLVVCFLFRSLPSLCVCVCVCELTKLLQINSKHLSLFFSFSLSPSLFLSLLLFSVSYDLSCPLAWGSRRKGRGVRERKRERERAKRKCE